MDGHAPLARWKVPGPRRLLAVLGPDAASAGQSLAALGINSMTSLVAGAVVGSMTPTLAGYPGLLVTVPAAIGLRGNVLSALGSRISTAVHAGTYRPSLRRGTVPGDNVAAAIVLSLVVALALAVRAGWDLDNLVAPVVSTLGDVVTAPSLGRRRRVAVDSGAPARDRA